MSRGPRAVKRSPIDERIDGSIVRTLEAGLSRLRGRRVRVRELHRSFSRSSSTFRTERLRSFLGRDKKPLRIFFKDLHPAHQVTDPRALHQVHPASWRCELDIYRSILSREHFGTLDLYAFRWEPERGHCWLFLEDAGRTPLNDAHDLREWTSAARWVARFHAATRRRPPARTRFLHRWDWGHYRRRAEEVDRLLPTVDARERAVFRAGPESLRARLDWLSALPPSVIHGQFFGKNVMLRPRRTRPRIAVIDWETAALGPRAFDLASLCSGGWSAEEQETTRVAYFEEHQAATGEAGDWDDFRLEVRAVGIYQALEWLVWWGPHRSVPRRWRRFQRVLRELERHLTERPAPELAAAQAVG